MVRTKGYWKERYWKTKDGPAFKARNQRYKASQTYKNRLKRLSETGKNRERRLKYRKTESYRKSNSKYQHTESYRMYHRKYSRRLKLKAIEKLGGKCCNPTCAVPGGMIDYRALQIDHINGDGCEERKTLTSSDIYRKIIKGETEGYQLLCANCNWIKAFEHNEFPNLKKRGIDKVSDKKD